MRLLPWLLMVLLLLLSNAQAQNNSLSPVTYNALTTVQEQLNAQEFEKAEATLHALEEDLTPGFGLALVFQLHGQMHLMKNEPEKALALFRKALALNVLSPPQESAIATTTAQVLLSLDRPEDALKELEPRLNRILELEQEDRRSRRQGDGDIRYVQPMGMITVGTAYQMRKQYKPSIGWLRKGIERSDSPRESWLMMLMVALYQERMYPETALVLDDLIRLNPSKEDYWQQQASVYQLQDKPALALRTLELGYAGGYVTRPDSILLLVQLLISENIPERAGRILHKHLENNSLELNERNWRLLAAAWQQGRERERAVLAMRSASQFMADGSLLYRAAQLQLQDAHYRGALEDAEAALKQGLNERDKPRALMLAANSAYELQDINTARRYFQQALTYPDTAANARSWLDYMGMMEQYQDVALSQ